MSCLSRVMCCRARTRAHLKLYQKPPLALNDTPPFAWGAFDHGQSNPCAVVRSFSFFRASSLCSFTDSFFFSCRFIPFLLLLLVVALSVLVVLFYILLPVMYRCISVPLCGLSVLCIWCVSPYRPLLIMLIASSASWFESWWLDFVCFAWSIA